jgi:hypothetical protein
MIEGQEIKNDRDTTFRLRPWKGRVLDSVHLLLGVEAIKTVLN